MIWQAARLADPYSIWFPYPPLALPFLWPLRTLSLDVSFWAFNAMGAAVLALAARPYTRYWPLAVLTPGAVMCVSYGQTGLIVGALWLSAFSGKAPAVALLAIKPHLGFLSIFTLRNRHSWAVAMTTLVALCLLPTILYGPVIWVNWVERSREMVALVSNWDKWDFIAVSPMIQWGFWPWTISALLAAYLLTKRFDAFTGATAALIISPYSFIYDTPVASLGIALSLIGERRPLKAIILGIALVAPSMIMFGAAWVPATLLAALWVQVNSGRHREPELA